MLETLVGPGQEGAQLHLHEHEEEAFFILEGDMVFFIKHEKVMAREGGLLTLSREFNADDVLFSY
ncbi:cupin domain-containing protein [Pseudochrobactrum asaccharolyticum]|uniref:cupin domain-containing protein n=1 Tax=Pseudochrobactrum asaccharolyticum TaxID=354351 RepID=UPI0040421686